MKTLYKCKHCGGNVTKDNSNKNWKVFTCEDCGSKAPLSTQDILKEV